jgi:hypothetical protein
MNIRAVIAASLIAASLIALPDAALAHPQLAGPPGTLTSRPALPNGYDAIYSFKNMITSKCIADVGTTGTLTCVDSWIFERWGFTYDYTDRDGHEVGTLQNLETGACLDDSIYGLRGYYCDQYHDSLRIFQQFKLTFFLGDHAYQLQNMATGSCVDDNLEGDGLHGNYCNTTYFQKWQYKIYT